jgi:transposase
MNNLPYVGVDVSKAHLDVATPLASQRYPNQPAAIAAWLKDLPLDYHLVVEATGGYERPLVQACHRSGRPISVLNPARVRHFARARGSLAKTDAIDAVVLREFGRALQPKALAESDPAQRQLAELLSARDQLVDLRTQLINGLEHAELSSVRTEFKSLVRALERRITKFEKALVTCIKACPLLALRYAFLRSQSGIGLITAATLLALLPELGSTNRNQIAALAGLAPYNRDSGLQSGPRFTGHGRPRLRRALYLASLSAVRSEGSPLAAFYQRLRLDGKPAKVALIASARKLICALNYSLKTLQY